MLGLNVGQEVLEKIVQKYNRSEGGRHTVQIRTKFFGTVPGKRTLNACKHQTGFMRIGPRIAVRFELNPVRLVGGRIQTGMSFLAAERCLLTCSHCGFAAKYNHRQLHDADRYYKIRLFNDIKKAEIEAGKNVDEAKTEAAKSVAAEEAEGGRNALCPKCDAIVSDKTRLRTVLYPTGAANDDVLAADADTGKALLDDSELGNPLPQVWALYALGQAPTTFEAANENEERIQKSSTEKGVSVLPYALAYEASKTGLGGIRGVVVQAPESGVCGEVERRLLELEPAESRQRFGFRFRVFHPRRR